MITYSELRKFQRLERENQALQDLGEDFPEKVREFIREKKSMIKEGEDPFVKEMNERVREELKNALRVIDDIMLTRERKVVAHALLSSKKDKATYNLSNMLEHEKKLFFSVLEAVKRARQEFKDAISSSQAGREKVKKETSFGKKMVRMLEDIPSFTWRGRVYGPFKREDVANLEEELAELLVSRGKAEALE